MTDLPAIISRDDAKAAGLRFYFTAIKCVKGHIAVRRTINGCCLDCEKLKYKNTRAKLIKQSDGTYIATMACKHCGTFKKNKHKSYVVCVRVRNKERSKIYWREVVKGTPKQKEYEKRSYEKNKEAYYEYSASRRARKRGQRIRNKDFTRKMRVFYKNCPDGYHVDHIIPLSGGDFVVGLHCPANLQYLTSAENLEKSNKWPTCQKSMQPAWFDDKN